MFYNCHRCVTTDTYITTVKDFTTVTNVTILTNVIPVTHVTTFTPHVGNSQEMLVSFINIHISKT